MCLRGHTESGGHCPAPAPLLKRLYTCSFGFWSCLEHWLMQLFGARQRQLAAGQTASPALGHQLYTETSETLVKVLDDHALRVVFTRLSTSTAQLWSNWQSTAWGYLLQTIAAAWVGGIQPGKAVHSWHSIFSLSFLSLQVGTLLEASKRWGKIARAMQWLT